MIQFGRNRCKLLQSRLQIVSNLLRQHIGLRRILQCPSARDDSCMTPRNRRRDSSAPGIAQLPLSRHPLLQIPQNILYQLQRRLQILGDLRRKNVRVG